MAIPFNPTADTYGDPARVEMNRRGRLKEIFDLWDMYPGRRPGGTGLTGLNRNDSRGWSQVLQDQIDAQALMSDEPVRVRTAPLQERNITPSLLGLHRSLRR